jgi:DNA-binding FadR family transcriptional regulator
MLATISGLLHALVARFYARSAARSSDGQMHRAVRSYRKLVRLIEAGDAVGAEEHWRRQMTFVIEGWHADQSVDLFDDEPWS